jgi:predicted glycoside hydrolase/deacetylase ChbG (UPF0249 family)
VRLLIVNADDFGLSRSVNRGIAEAHERGILTSTSLMVRGPAASEAAAYAHDQPGLGVGLHADLRHWRVRRTPWSSVRTEERLQRAVRDDLAEQLDRFGELLGRAPTHIDSHHHRHRRPELRAIFEEAAAELDVPLRHLDRRVLFCGEFYGHDGSGQPDPDAITPRALVALLEGLPADASVVELGCHAGYPDDLDSWYRAERAQEVASLCDPAVRDAVERLGFELASFASMPRRREGALQS